ncbi:MAG: TauD/TfdA family dioxygenase [Gammaproteobacteria bacterium]|nr:TauD/TfdA family dioxygenase [Gammaproteobacteria bacterium]
MHTTPLTDTFGVRIEGVDLSRPLDDRTFAEVRSLWMEHRVAVFPDQRLDDPALVSFAGRFGRLFVHAQTSLLSKQRPEVMELSNLPDAQRKTLHELDWHTDQSYTPQPVFGTLLFGVVAPTQGGETLIADLAGAYADLPQRLRAQVEGQTAVYSAEPRPKIRETPLTEEERARIPDCTHPIVRTHPYLGRKALYLSPLHMKSIGDLSESDSLALLEELTAHAAQPAHVYRHRWQEGDVLMWDNTSVMHRRTPFPADMPRHLKRTGFYLPDERAVPF